MKNNLIILIQILELTKIIITIICGYNFLSFIPPPNFHDVNGDLSDHKNCWIVQNSDNNLVTSCFTRIYIHIGITRSLILYFVLGS